MKKLIYLIAAILISTILFIGCSEHKKMDNQSGDYDNASFVDVSWTREAEHDTETIRFGADGSFTYSCSCGNPVNDSDLCEGYSYDDATKTITLNCIEITDEMVTTIKVVKCDKNSLHLDFNGEIRIFEK